MPTVEDHAVLDEIAGWLGRLPAARQVSRESECVEFTDASDGRRFEVVVREIDRDDDDEARPA